MFVNEEKFMMKIHYRIIALFMAFTVTLSTAGVAVSKHICGNVVEKIAINHPADRCIHDTQPMTISCPVHGEMQIGVDASKMNCCEETTDYFRDDHPKNLNTTDVSFIPELIVLYTFTLTDILATDYLHGSKLHAADAEIPPLINQDKYVLVESFRL